MERRRVLSGIKMFLTLFGLATELATLVFAFLSNAPSSLQTDVANSTSAASGIFIQAADRLAKKYPSTIGPAAWVFAVIWPIIFLWNTVGALYMTASLCLPSGRSPVLRDPPLIPVASLVAWIFAWGGSLAWTFLYDREYTAVALFFLVLAAVTSYAFLGFAYHAMTSDLPLLEGFSPKMVWLVRILIHNGFAIYATWVTCAWKLNLATVITYVDSRGIDKIPADETGNLTSEDAGTVGLSILMVELVVWFILENFVFEKYCRYTHTIYPTLIFAFSGILVLNYAIPFSRNQAITIAALILACIAFAIRVPLAIYRHRNAFLYA